MEIINCILKLLDNTFIGTLSAGLLLALFRFYLYKEQKKTDLEFEDVKRRRELASLLFAKIQIAAKNYEAQVNIHNGKHDVVQKLYSILNSSTNDHFKREFSEDFENYTKELTRAADELVAMLKMNEEFKKEMETISEKVPFLNFMLLGVSVMHMSDKAHLDSLAALLEETVGQLNSALSRVLETRPFDKSKGSQTD